MRLVKVVLTFEPEIGVNEPSSEQEVDLDLTELYGSTVKELEAFDPSLYLGGTDE